MELEDLAADVFNRDEAVLETFDAVSWRQQVCSLFKPYVNWSLDIRFFQPQFYLC